MLACKSFYKTIYERWFASGSLLEINGYNTKRPNNTPVDFEHTVYMKPMDLEEFLWPKGINKDVFLI